MKAAYNAAHQKRCGRRRTKLNQVSVTPLLPLHADDTTLYVDAMTSLVQPTRR